MDVCLLEMQFWREFKDGRMGGFKSHEAKFMDVIAALLSAQGFFRAANEALNLQVVRHKNGCTCNECIGGFLSPKMAFRSGFPAQPKWLNTCVLIPVVQYGRNGELLRLRANFIARVFFFP